MRILSHLHINLISSCFVPPSLKQEFAWHCNQRVVHITAAWHKHTHTLSLRYTYACTFFSSLSHTHACFSAIWSSSVGWSREWIGICRFTSSTIYIISDNYTFFSLPFLLPSLNSFFCSFLYSDLCFVHRCIGLNDDMHKSLGFYRNKSCLSHTNVCTQG